jgi:hypothetical protein
MTYLLSGEEICETVKPACLLTSSNRGVGGAAFGLCAQAVEHNSRATITFMERMEYDMVARENGPPFRPKVEKKGESVDFSTDQRWENHTDAPVCPFSVRTFLMS